MFGIIGGDEGIIRVRGKFDHAKICNIHEVFAIASFGVKFESSLHRAYIVVFRVLHLLFNGSISQVSHYKSISHVSLKFCVPLLALDFAQGFREFLFGEYSGLCK